MPSITNAIGAICLNESGMNYTKEHPDVIRNLIKSAANTPVDDTALAVEKGHPQTALGESLDELVRHHPPLRPILLSAILVTLGETMNSAAAFEPTEETKKFYIMNPGENEVVGHTETAPPTESLEKLMRIWMLQRGLFRNVNVCKDFIAEGGLDLLSRTPELPCIPVHMRGSEWAMTIVEVFREIGKHDHVRLVKHHVEVIESILSETTSLWKGNDAEANWGVLESGSADEALLHAFKRFRGLALSLFLLSSTFMVLSFTHSRVATSLIQSMSKSFISDLGLLDRVCYLQYIRINPLDTLNKAFDTAPAVCIGADQDLSATPSAETGVSKMVRRIHSVSVRLFRGLIKLLFVKRSPDAAHRKEAEPLAETLSAIIYEDLQHAALESTPIGAATCGFGLASLMLFDDRSFDGHLNTPLFLAFEEMGGLKLLVSVATKIVDHMDATPITRQEVEQKGSAREAAVAIRLVIAALNGLVKYKAHHGPQATALQTQLGSSGKPISIARLFVETRLLVAPSAHRIWKSKWLAACPESVVKLAVTTFLSIMDNTGEDEKEPSAEPPTPVPRPRPALAAAEPARVDQLVDMGFTRGAAEYALQRARNNVAAAADLILSMPHLFAEIPDVPNPPPVAETAADAPTTATTDTAPDAPTDESTAVSIDVNMEAVPSSAAPTQPTKPTPVPLETVQADLTSLRESYKPELPQRALELVDVVEDLVYDLVSAFPKKQEGLSYILSRTTPLVEPYTSDHDQILRARLRLISAFLRNGEPTRLDSSSSPGILQLFNALPFDATPHPIWTSAFLFFTESIFVLVESVRETKLGSTPTDVARPMTALQRYMVPLTDLCAAIASNPDATREDVISALRLLVILTRHELPSVEVLEQVLAPARMPSSKYAGCQPYLAIVARHALEDPATLKSVMQSEILQWLSPMRNKVTDASHYVKQLRQVAAREPTMFVQVTEDLCELVDPTPPQMVYHIRSKSGESHIEAPKSDTALSLLTMLLTQLASAINEAQRPVGELTLDELSNKHSYAGFLLSLITELVGSYIPAKMAFRTAIRQQGKPISGLNAFMTDLVCGIDLMEDLASGVAKKERSSTRRIAISTWSMALLVALCSDIHTDAKTPASEDMTALRRSVLDVVVKLLKDLGSADTAIRYARLWAMSELVFRLLVAKPAITSTRDKDDSSIQIAKLMLEKGIVNLLATAIGEADLNYPDIKVVLASALRALECL